MTNWYSFEDHSQSFYSLGDILKLCMIILLSVVCRFDSFFQNKYKYILVNFNKPVMDIFGKRARNDPYSRYGTISLRWVAWSATESIEKPSSCWATPSKVTERQPMPLLSEHEHRARKRLHFRILDCTHWWSVNITTRTIYQDVM